MVPPVKGILVGAGFLKKINGLGHCLQSGRYWNHDARYIGFEFSFWLMMEKLQDMF